MCNMKSVFSISNLFLPRISDERRKGETESPDGLGKCRHLCAKYCRPDISKYEEMYREGFKQKELLQLQSDSQDFHEETFPLGRFRERLQLCFGSNYILIFNQMRIR